MGMIPKPESQQFQGLAPPNKDIMPTYPCKVGTDQILCNFIFAINITNLNFCLN